MNSYRKIGIITWDCCDACEHYPSETGGCALLIEQGFSIGDLVSQSIGDPDTIICDEFKLREE